MSGTDLSPANIATAKVVVKRLWARYGDEPLIVQLAITPEAREAAWEEEARRYIIAKTAERHFQQKPGDFIKGQTRPPVWDEEFVGERPGIDDPVLSKELKRFDAYYVSGPVRSVKGKIK